MCRKERNINTYIIMEKVDGDVTHLENFSPYSLFMQISFAIACLQSIGIVHNDLHLENILYQTITPETEFQGQKLYDADYFEYTYKHKNYYLSRKQCNHIFKITDFGWATKFPSRISNKIVTNSEIFSSDLPTEFSETYDLAHFLEDFAITYRNHSSNSSFLNKFAPKIDVRFNFFRAYNYIKKYTPDYMFKIFAAHKTKPKPGDKVVNLGTLNI